MRLINGKRKAVEERMVDNKQQALLKAQGVDSVLSEIGEMIDNLLPKKQLHRRFGHERH